MIRCQGLEGRHFYPRSPCGERPITKKPPPIVSAFLSTLSLRRATHSHRLQKQVFTISIHALLAESDFKKVKWRCNIRDFYPRSPCGERRSFRANINLVILISIHALLAESDKAPADCFGKPSLFLSTLSLRRATAKELTLAAKNAVFLSTLSLRRATTSLVVIGTNCVISIHALLAESDVLGAVTSPAVIKFLSTLSLRRATQCRTFANGMYGFLSTLSLRRATKSPANSGPCIRYFYPRSPCGERHVACGDWHELRDFYPRSPCGERPHLVHARNF